jgi:hypothetical protein
MSAFRCRWGLVLYWAKNINIGYATFNPKAEGIEPSLLLLTEPPPSAPLGLLRWRFVRRLHLSWRHRDRFIGFRALFRVVRETGFI